MTIKIYDKDFAYTSAEVLEAQNQLNGLAPGISVSRMSTLGRFELPLAAELSASEQSAFLEWLATNHPDWSADIR